MPTHHNVPLDPHLAPAQPSIETLAALTPVAWHPVRNLCVAQDTLVGSARRALVHWGLRGSDDWPWDQAGPTSAYPNNDDWRVVQPATAFRLTPGSYLRLRVLHCPSGMTRLSATADLDQPDGWVRVEVTWTNGASSSGPHTFDLQLPSVTGDGDMPTGAGEAWGQLYERSLEDIKPPGVDGSLATSEQWSEGTVATIAVYVRGGARIVDGVVHEHPSRHTSRHDETDPRSCHAAVVGGGPPLVALTAVPQTDRADGATYDDRRFGSHQILRVAARQSAVLGPRVMSWTPWASDNASFTQNNTHGQNDVEPLRITGVGPTHLLTGVSSGWDPDEAGWLVSASHAQLHRYCEPGQIMRGGGRAVVEVTVHVRARWTGAAGSGVLRLQSSATEWVEIEFSSSGTVEDRTVYGFLESQVAGDHAAAVLQAIVTQTAAADTLDVYAIAIEWGWGA